MISATIDQLGNMGKLVWLLVIFSKIDLSLSEVGAAACPDGFTYFSSINGCYQLILQKLTWPNATRTCASLASGAHLAFIGSVNEDQIVSGLASSKSGRGVCHSDYFGLGSEWWLGAQRIDPSYKSDFYWKTSQASAPVSGLEYSNWNPGQPDNIALGEECAVFIPAWSNKWNDSPCVTQTFCSVCELDVPVPDDRYCIHVHTSNIGHASTKAKVFIKLFGNTNSSEFELFNSTVDSFAQGQVSKFCLDIPSVGPVNRITIRHDNSGAGSSWFLEKVVIQDSTKTYTFPAYRWLAVDKIDGATSVDLTLERDNLAWLKPTWQSSTYVTWGSSRAVDGVKNRMPGDLASCSSTLAEMNAWWAVDLGKPVFVEGVQITTRADGGGEFVSALIVGLTNTPPTRMAPVPLPANYHICNSGPRHSKLAEYIYVMCQQTAELPSTRYVIVQLNQTSNYLSLCEVEVFGSIDSGACNSNPCYNGGTCVSGDDDSFVCSCAVGYSGSTCATPGCPDGFSYVSGVNGCYKLMITNAPWETAALACDSLAPGAHLAFVDSELEQRAIANLIATHAGLESTHSGSLACNGAYVGVGVEWWLGGQRIDPNTRSDFHWKSPSTNDTIPLIYSNWYSGQPDYCCGGESCLALIPGWAYRWNDASCEKAVFCGVCEFELGNTTTVNLALDQPAMQSSTYSRWTATRGTDGNKDVAPGDAGSCFGTNSEANAWWAVDLGQPAHVQGVLMVYRSDCCADGHSGTYIGLTNIAPSTTSPPQYSNYNICARGPTTVILGKTYVVRCAPDLPASRYVVVQIDGPNHLGFCEIEVYGSIGTVTGLCANMPCLNGGTCANDEEDEDDDSYTCTCALGWTGTNCSTVASNLALSKPATQSSTFAGWNAGRAVDGNPSTIAGAAGSCSSTDNNVNAWWAVDLETPTFVHGVKLVNREDGLARNQGGFIVGLTNMDPSARAPHPTSYTVGVCGRGPVNTVQKQSYWVRCVADEPSTRFVVIQIETRAHLAICELYVYGRPDDGPCATSPCENGGKCLNSEASFECVCAVGWTGKNCSTAAVNLALNRPAVQSTTHANWEAELATDGNTATSARNCAVTKADWSAWWAVDLGAQTHVHGIKLTNRGDCCGELDSNFIVGLTNTPTTRNLPDPTNYVTCGIGPRVTDLNTAYYVRCAANLVPARYVIIQLPATAPTHLAICELEVYGNPDASACSSNPCRNGGTCVPSNGGFTCKCFVGWTNSTCNAAAVNVARGRLALQSSTYGRWTAVRGTDGNRDSTGGDLGSCSATAGGEPHPWWSVDLAQATQVLGVLYCMEKTPYLGDRDKRIIIGLTNVSPAMIAPTPGGYTVCGYSISAQVASAQIYILCAANQSPSRYVIVQFEHRSDHLRVCELEVYSSPGFRSPNPCRNGGTCTNAGFGFTCTYGYTGTDCSNPIDVPIDQTASITQGENRSSDGDFINQTCPTGRTGVNCETELLLGSDPCEGTPCANGGQCTSSGTAYSCTCVAGWTGSTCQEEVNADPCDSTPCSNNGQCVSDNNSYSCNCSNGWTGHHCSTPADAVPIQLLPTEQPVKMLLTTSTELADGGRSRIGDDSRLKSGDTPSIRDASPLNASIPSSKRFQEPYVTATILVAGIGCPLSLYVIIIALYICWRDRKQRSVRKPEMPNASVIKTTDYNPPPIVFSVEDTGPTIGHFTRGKPQRHLHSNSSSRKSATL